MLEMTTEQLRKVAPSIFATTPWADVSAAYKFIPTIRILEEMRKEGFVPVKATQSASRIEGKGEFTKHMLRLRHQSNMGSREVGTEIPELVLVNSHDRSSGYQLHAGVFRLVCSNGMVVKSSDFGSISVRHSGKVIDDVIEGSYRIVREMPGLMDRINDMKQIRLVHGESLALANAALQLRYPDDEYGLATAPIRPEQLLAVRRNEDRDNTLWGVFNRIQENFIKGGIRSYSKETGRKGKTRAVKSVDADLRLNRSLWVLAERMQELKTA